MSSASLVKQAWNPETDELDLGELFPALRQYCPILYRRGDQPGIHDSPKQCAFLISHQREVFYGGAAGGGKSAALLAAALQYVDVPGYNALILRRTFPQLSQPGMLIQMADEWLGQTDARRSEGGKEWTFPSGAVLKFGHVKDEQAALNYQGGAYHFVGFDELTQFTETQYKYIAFSRQRRDTRMRELGIPTRVRATANPGGIGHAWVKDRFIETPGAIFIPAKVRDNPGLDAVEYEESLSHLGQILRRQLMDGDWDAFEGAAYPMLNHRLHVVDAFDVPEAWERFESFDPGTTNPAAILAYAVDHDGNIIVFDELYVDDPIPHLPDLVVERLKERRASWHQDGASVVCLADPAAFSQGVATKWGRQPSVADEFARAGVPLTKAATNDRVAGYVRIGQLLTPDPAHAFPDWHERAGELGAPRIFFFNCCTNLIEQLQAAPLEELTEPHPGEAVSRRWEGPWGHSHAALRYGVVAWPTASTKPYEPLDDERAEWLRQYASRVEKPKRTPRDYQL